MPLILNSIPKGNIQSKAANPADKASFLQILKQATLSMKVALIMSHRLSRRMKIRKDKKRLSKKKKMKRELILMTPTKLTRSTRSIMKILRSSTLRSLMNSLIYN